MKRVQIHAGELPPVLGITYKETRMMNARADDCLKKRGGFIESQMARWHRLRREAVVAPPLPPSFD